jgi:anti-sigma factor RsiW
MITEHVSFDRLCELADHVLAPDDRAVIERHLVTCVACRAELAKLRALLDHAAALPSSVEPPAEAWEALRAQLRPQSRGIARHLSPRTRDWGWRAAAAAILLVAGSSALTVLVLRSRPSDSMSTAQQSTVAVPVLPAAVRAVEQSYDGVVEELTLTLRAQRGALAPETIATVERSLRVIDEAIAEARAALAADPRNDALLDILSANYEQKVQLLRRASELPART